MNVMLYKKTYGATLLESLLVLVIAAMIVLLGLNYTIQQAERKRLERMAAQMQQILNAGQAYYSVNQAWPTPPNLYTSLTNYLTPGMVSPLGGQNYSIGVAPATGINTFYVYTSITSTTPGKANQRARIVAGMLPLSYVTKNSPVGNAPPTFNNCTAADTTCTVVAAVNIPAQVLNRIRGITWAGLVRHGGCVPVVACPANMTPQIMITPASMSGVNERNPLNLSQMNIYPISSFTAYASGPPSITPARCVGTTSSTNNCPNDGNRYWRACAQLITEKGNVSTTASASQWGQYILLMAVTRCTTASEPSGNGLSVYSN